MTSEEKVMPGREKCPFLGGPDKRGKGVYIQGRGKLKNIGQAKTFHVIR